MMNEADAMLKRIRDAGGHWSDIIGQRPIGRELMRAGLIELIKPPAPYLPYAVLTISGERRARAL